MKKRKILLSALAVLAFALMIMLVTVVPVNAAHNVRASETSNAQEGWNEINGFRYYYVNGTYKTGWLEIDSEWYLFDSNGRMLTGWQRPKNAWYYLNPDGKMVTGWQKIDGDWYHFNSGGAMQTGWQEIDGSWYLFDGSGRMLTGWQRPKSAWYYLNSDGKMVTGWQKIDGDWYYFNSGGAMQTGWVRPASVWYYLNGSGKMLTDWQKIDGYWYYFNSNGAMQTGWKEINGKWYLLDGSGKMLTGWQKPKSVWYYLKPSGEMVTGWQVIDGKPYYFNSNGAAQNITYSKSNVSVMNTTTNLKLKGYVYKPSISNKKTVIICHGLGGYASQGEPIAQYLAKYGYTVFAFDFAGGGPKPYSTSEGSTTNMSVLTELKDMEYIYNYVAGQSVDSSAIYVAAHSQGALVSGIYAARNPGKIKALVFYAPGFVVANDWAPGQYSDIPSGNVWMWDDMVAGRKYYADLWTLLGGSRTKIYSLMSPYSGPVLMLHGTSDYTTSIGYTKTMKNYYQNARVIEYPGADHVFSGGANHDKLLEDTIWFISTNW